jgi:hypothetical protein
LKTELNELAPIVTKYLSASPELITTDALDPLGLGTHLITAQYISGPKGDAYRSSLLKIARPSLRSSLVAAREGDALNFRVYGALLGCQVSGDPGLSEAAREAAWIMLEAENKTRVGDGDHGTINKVGGDGSGCFWRGEELIRREVAGYACGGAQSVGLAEAARGGHAEDLESLNNLGR